MEELLPHDVVEHILERLAAKTLLKFKTVSKQWKSTIQSQYFQKRQLIHCRQPGDPHVLFVSIFNKYCFKTAEYEAMRTVVVGSPVSVQIPTLWEDKKYHICDTSCDGLICLYNIREGLPNIVFNPTTRVHRSFPRCSYQLVAVESLLFPLLSPGFGKDKISTGTYKVVWLYNSAELGLNDNTTTTCEVFDFATNTWRYIVPASPHLILQTREPVYVNGSLHWFTAFSDEGETKVLSLDLHTETFQVISKAPSLHHAIMCNLDGRLCVSKTDWANHVIWSFDSDHKTWKKIWLTSSLERHIDTVLTPLAVLGDDKLLFYYRYQGKELVTYDLKTKSTSFAYNSKLHAYGVCYYIPSLISIL